MKVQINLEVVVTMSKCVTVEVPDDFDIKKDGYKLAFDVYKADEYYWEMQDDYTYPRDFAKSGYSEDTHEAGTHECLGKINIKKRPEYALVNGKVARLSK